MPGSGICAEVLGVISEDLSAGRLTVLKLIYEMPVDARIIGKLHADLRYDDEAQMRRGDFAGLLDHVVGELAKTHDAIATQYFVT